MITSYDYEPTPADRVWFARHDIMTHALRVAVPLDVTAMHGDQRQSHIMVSVYQDWDVEVEPEQLRYRLVALHIPYAMRDTLRINGWAHNKSMRLMCCVVWAAAELADHTCGLPIYRF